MELVGYELAARPPYLNRRYPFRPDPRLLAALSPELSAPATWSASQNAALPDGELTRIFLSTPGLHKWLHYLPIYEKTLSDMRHQPARFLEIGIQRGGSLAAWRRYFGSAATVVGIDIDRECRQYDNPSDGTYVRIGAQQDAAFLRSVVEEFGKFDAILDDGSHMASHMIASFNFLFPHGLAPGGIYLVEDLHAGYWTAFRDRRYTFVDMAKGLVDVLHAHYRQATHSGDFQFGWEQRRPVFTVPAIARAIDSVEFHDSIVVIRKSKDPRELPSNIKT
jgi:hypothetical protein